MSAATTGTGTTGASTNGTGTTGASTTGTGTTDPTTGRAHLGPHVERFDAWADAQLERLRGHPVADRVFASHTVGASGSTAVTSARLRVPGCGS